MTRVNYGVHPSKLIDKLVRAEHREIVRVPNDFAKRMAIDHPMNDIPPRVLLNKGHVKYFMAHGKHTHERLLLLQEEMIIRKMNFTDYSSAWDIYEEYPEWYNEVPPQPHGYKILQERLFERIDGYVKPNRYFGKEISKDDAKKLIIEPNFEHTLKMRLNIDQSLIY